MAEASGFELLDSRLRDLNADLKRASSKVRIGVNHDKLTLRATLPERSGNGYSSCKFSYARNEDGQYYVVPKDPMGSEGPTASRIPCLLEKHWNEGQSNGILRTSDIAKRLMLKDKTVSNKLTALKMTSPQYVKHKGRGWKLAKAGVERAKALNAEAINSMFKKQ